MCKLYRKTFLCPDERPMKRLIMHSIACITNPVSPVGRSPDSQTLQPARGAEASGEEASPLWGPVTGSARGPVPAARARAEAIPP